MKTNPRWAWAGIPYSFRNPGGSLVGLERKPGWRAGEKKKLELSLIIQQLAGGEGRMGVFNRKGIPEGLSSSSGRGAGDGRGQN